MWHMSLVTYGLYFNYTSCTKMKFKCTSFPKMVSHIVFGVFGLKDKLRHLTPVAPRGMFVITVSSGKMCLEP